MVTKAQLINALNAETVTHFRHGVSIQNFVALAIGNAKFTLIENAQYPEKRSQPEFMVKCEGEELTVCWEYDDMYFKCSDGIVGYHIKGKYLF